MRLIVDLQAVQGPSAERGIGYYATALTRALAQSRGEHEVRVLLDGGGAPEPVLLTRRALAPVVAPEDVVLFPSDHCDPRGAQASREACLAALQPDMVLLTSMFELHDGASVTIGEHCPAPATAVLLHDLIPLTDLAAHKPDRRLRETYLAGVRSLSRADLLLTNSDHTAEQARSLLASCPPTHTVRGGPANPAPARRPVAAPPPGFGLAVGRHEPRKDIRTAVLGWAGLRAEVRQGRPFVVVGPWDDTRRVELEEQAQQAGLPHDQLLFVRADDAELAWYYENAAILVFPSLEEGLGMPPLEAARAGTPALIARTSSLVELNDDERVFFAAGDVDGLTRLLAEVLSDDALREDLVMNARRAADRFTWERTAERTWTALEPLARPPATTSRVIVHEPGEDLAERLVHQPGVVSLREVPDGASELLAPAIAVVCPDVAMAAALIATGVTSLPLPVAETEHELRCAVRAAFDSDPLEHWAQAAAAHDLPLESARPLLRRPPWAIRPRGPVLGSDVSLYRSTPFLSGIQRTVARLHAELGPLLGLAGGGIVPLELGESSTGTPHPDIAADPVLATPVVPLSDVDWALCLDLDAGVVQHRATLQRARAAGTCVATNVFDLLPWTHSEWWPKGAAEDSFLPWLEAVLAFSDVLLVNSFATARDLEAYVAQSRPGRVDGFEVQLLRLGSDFRADPAPDPQERDDEHLLIVGTVEPRKGHAELLDAVEQLWAQGRRVRLTVVGRAGWMVEDLVRRMQGLTAVQPAFAWLQGASDVELDRLYRTCTAAVVASQAEGFGLPVVEAAVRGCPVVVRDVPVLRELAGEGATYFSAQQPLVDVLRRALDDPSSVALVPVDGLSTWTQAAQRLLDVLAGQVTPVASWDPATGWCWV